MTLVALLFVLSQIMALNTTDVTQLWQSSLALGLAYGSLFGLYPAIAIEWFGLGERQHYSPANSRSDTDSAHSALFRELGFSIVITYGRW